MSMRDKVINVFCDVMQTSVDALPDEVTPETVEEWDSIRHLNLILAIEEACSVELDEDEVEGLLSLDALVQAVEKAQS